MVYLDYAATTPDLTDYKTLNEKLQEKFGNPSSSHSQGREARELIDEARLTIAQYIGCHPQRLTFTSGATEANNLAIIGWMLQRQSEGKQFAVLYSPTAHHSMIEPALQASRYGGFTKRLRVDKQGMLDESYLANLLSSLDINHIPALVCFEWVNNETGVIQNEFELVQMCHVYHATVLVDAVQALPTGGVQLPSVGADYMSFSAHKIYGPKGIGALYCRERNLTPILYGGQQEWGIRAGTENVMGILGFAQAITRLKALVYEEVDVASELRKALMQVIVMNNADIIVNGAPSPNHSPVILNLNCKVDGSALANLLETKGYQVSTGAACSGTEEKSHVLLAMGLEDAATQSIRVSFSGRFTKKEEIVSFGHTLLQCIQELKE